jgi:hypothetical protein
LFARHGARLRTWVRDAVARGERPLAPLAWHLRAYRRVAAAHRLTLSPEHELHAAARLASALTARVAL